MAGTIVYRSFEVREGFGPNAEGPVRFESSARAEADRMLEQLAAEGRCAQLFGIRPRDNAGDGERVLLRMLVGRRAA